MDTIYGKMIPLDKPSIDLSPNALQTYEIMVESFWNHMREGTSSDNFISQTTDAKHLLTSDNKLIARLTLEKENGKDICHVKWGYDIDPEKSVSLEELQSIEYVGNLNTVLDSEYRVPVEIKDIIFAIFETIRKHYNKLCILEHIGSTLENPDMNMYI